MTTMQSCRALGAARASTSPAANGSWQSARAGVVVTPRPGVELGPHRARGAPRQGVSASTPARTERATTTVARAAGPKQSAVEQAASSGTSSGSSGSISSQGSMGSIDYDLLMSQSPTCPLGGVLEVMISNARGVSSCGPDETLEAIIPKLSKFSGLPVIDASGQVVGVISRKDIIRVRKGSREGSLQDPVKSHMSTPPITVKVSASVQEAADLMLKHKVRRLPVLDDAGMPVGLLARSDIFKPLFEEQYMEYLDREVAAVEGRPVKKKKKKVITWAIKYLYDGDCAMCRSLKAVLERRDAGKGRIKFVNIASPNYSPSKNMGIEYEDAMETIHAIRPDGQVLYGTDALRAMFGEVGLGWAANMSALPGFSGLVDRTYNFLSANRISLGGAMDALIAVKRVEMSKQGKETCQDMDEECTVEW